MVWGLAETGRVKIADICESTGIALVGISSLPIFRYPSVFLSSFYDVLLVDLGPIVEPYCSCTL